MNRHKLPVTLAENARKADIAGNGKHRTPNVRIPASTKQHSLFSFADYRLPITDYPFHH
jgi:hypothetical protein